MKVAEIRNGSELQELRPAWEALLETSTSKTIFLTWEWLTAWWSSYESSGELRVLAAFDDNDVLRGIAPLHAKSVRRYGQTVAALSFIGDGTFDSDYLDFIVAAGYEKPVMDAFRRHWMEELNRGAVLLLNEIPDSSCALPHLKPLAQSRDIVWTETDVTCATVRLPDTWEGYLGTLRPRFRTKIRSVIRNLDNRPEVRFGFCENVEHLQRMLPVLFDLHTRRWARDGKPGVFRWDQKREFYFSVAPLLLERNRLRFSWLTWNGQVLACQYGFTYNGTYFHLQEGYEPASEHWNIGLGLRAWSIREFLKEGLREYDFLGGLGRHKTDWGATTKISKQIRIGNATYKNLLFCRGTEWEHRVRESVRTLVPEKILASRRTRLERRTSEGIRKGQNEHTVPPGKDWMQKAAARCYFYSQLPALVRPVRERYQLSICHNGNGRRISFEKRMEPSVRILCYHRVNDDMDPFFPSTATKLFEQEMRYVSRHYKVVSLARALDHLREDSSETVMAITLDDGYQDNYHNAFPIFQRYGLPATIFLATGSIDARTALWFEQLAHAIKHTEQDYIDLEIDMPQRFWMRTQPERLEANRCIFRLLRSLEEFERQYWVSDILRRLSVAFDEKQRGRMLTWDQIRLMKGQRISFGGHTVTHPFVSKITGEQLTWEVHECKRRIEEEVQLPVEHFAYPNGRDEDFDPSSKEVIRRAGYHAAVTTIWGMNYPSTDLMELRRGGPWEEHLPLFASKLDWYQLVND